MISDEDLMASVWPRGFSPEDQAAWNRLSPDRKNEALKRLRAVMKVVAPTDGQPALSATDAAKEAGVSRRSMFLMVKEWRRPDGIGRSLAALGFRPRNQKRSLGDDWAAVERKVRAYVRRRLRKGGDIATEDLISGASKLALEPIPSRTTLFRWITDEKRARAAGAVFGGRIRIDRVAIEATDLDGWRYYLFAVVDMGARLVLGWRLVDERSRNQGEGLRAALDAIDRLPRMSFTSLPVADGPTVVEYVAIGSAVELFHQHKRWGEHSIDEPKRFGRAITRALGERIGPYRLAAGLDLGSISARNRKETQFPSIAPEEMNGLVERELSFHNNGIFECFPAGPLEAVDLARPRVIARLQGTAAIAASADASRSA